QARARGRGPVDAGAPRRAARRGGAPAEPVRRRAGTLRALLETARRALLPAQRPAGRRLAYARAAPVRRHDGAGRSRAGRADRRRIPGRRLPARPAGPVRAHLRLFRQQEPVGAGREDPHDRARLCARQLRAGRPDRIRAVPRHPVAGRSRAGPAAGGGRRASDLGEGFQVVVYQPDQPDLFARICGYFDSKNLSVLDAKIHTTEHGYALDSFVLVDPTGSAQYRDILSLVEAELAQRLAAGGELP